MKIKLERLLEVDSDFSAKKPFGRILTSEDTDLALVPFSDFIVSVLKADAKMMMPPNTPFEIRASIPGNFGRTKAYVWYYSPDMDKREDISTNGKWHASVAMGYMTAGIFLT